MSGKEIVGLREAARLAGVSRMAVSQWCRRYDIGELHEGVWRIDRGALMRIVKARAVLGRK